MFVDSVAIQCEAVVVDRPTHTEDVPVSSVILAKECLFFRRLFDGECFKEAKEKIIDIHLKLEGRHLRLSSFHAIFSCCSDATAVGFLPY